MAGRVIAAESSIVRKQPSCLSGQRLSRGCIAGERSRGVKAIQRFGRAGELCAESRRPRYSVQIRTHDLAAGARHDRRENGGVDRC